MSLGWPFDARQKSYTANTTRIAAVDLNAIQDQIIALSRGRSRATANWGVGAFTAAPGATRIGEFYVSAAAGATTPAMKLGVATGYGAPTVELLSGVNTADSFISPGYDTATGLFYYQTWLDHTMTADIALTAIGANNASAYIGTVAASNTAARFSGARFRKLSGNTNWQAECDSGAATTTVDTGVPPVANTIQELRFQLTGSGTTSGLRCLFWIDRVLVATITTNLYVGATALTPGIEIIGTGANTTKMEVGRVDVEWTRRNGY